MKYFSGTIGTNPKLLALSGWIVAALLLLALACSSLPELLAGPGITEGKEFAAVRSKLRELTDATVSVPEQLPTNLDRLMVSAPSPAPGASGASGQGVGGTIEPSLPVLSGIMKTATVRGTVRYRAIFAGRDLGVNDKVDGFSILRISEAGVVLGKNGERWTLPSPEVIFSHKQE